MQTFTQDNDICGKIWTQLIKINMKILQHSHDPLGEAGPSNWFSSSTKDIDLFGGVVELGLTVSGVKTLTRGGEVLCRGGVCDTIGDGSLHLATTRNKA